MSSIDNRIVVLTFDNKNFEKNVQTSMSTLDKLKNGLKFDGATKGLDKLSASAKTINLSPIGSAIESIRDRFTNLGVIGMTVLQNLTNTAVDFGKRLVSSILTPITSGGWKRALNVEQATFQMEGLIGKTEGGAEKIKAIMESVTESVQGTAYGADQAARVASQLVATGVEDSQQMLKYLQGVAGAAAMTGGAYDEIGHIFTTIAGQGRLMGDQLNQFAYRGLNIAATLSKQMGITEAEFRDLVSKGKISFEQFAEGMAEAFGEHATKANDTFTGSLSNMKAALARIGQEFASPALKYFRDIFYSLKLLIDQVHERLKPLIALINDQLISNAGKLVDFIDSVTELLGGESQRMKKAAEDTAEATEETAERVKASAEEIEEAAQKVLAGEYGNGNERRRQLEELGLSYEKVQNRVNELLGCSYRYEVQEDELTESIKEGGDATRETADATDELKEKTKAWQKFLAKSAWYNFVAALKNIAGAIKGFGGAGVEAFKEMFTSETGTAFIKGVEQIANHFNRFTRELKLNEDQANGLKNIFKGFFWVIEQGVKLVGKFVDFGITISGGIVGLVKKFLGFIGTAKLFNGEIDETTKKGQFIIALRDAFGKLGDSFRGLKDKFKGAFELFKKSDTFQKLKENAIQLRDALKETGGKILESLTEKLKKFTNSDILPNFSTIKGWFETAGEYLAKFVGWLAEGVPKVEEFFKSFRDSATGKFGSFVDFLILAKDAIVNFFKGVDIETGELNLFGKLKEAISKGMDGLGQFFADIHTDGFVKGFEQFIQNISDAFNSIDPETLEKIKKWATIALAITGIITLLRTIKSLTNLFESISGLTDVFGLKGFAEAINNRTKLLKIGMFLAGIITIVGSIKVLSEIEPEKLATSVEIIAGIIAGLAGVFYLIGKMQFNDKAMRSFGLSMAGLGIGLLGIAGAAKILSTMEWPVILSSAGKVAVFLGIMALAARIAGTANAGGTFLGLAAALNLLLIPIMVLGHTKMSVINKAAKAIGIIAIELGIAARIAGNVKAAAAFMGLAVAIDLLVPAVAILGHMKWDTIKQGATALGIIMAEIAIACRIAASANAGKGAGAILAMAVAIGVAVVALKVLGEMDADALKRGTLALGIIIGEIAIVMGIAKGCASSWGALLAMAGVIAAATISLYVLAKTPWAKLKAGAISMGLVMTAAGIAVRIASQGSFKQQLGGLLAMAGVMAAACAALWFLAKQPWEGMLAGAISLSALVISVGAALKLMQGTTFTGALKNAAALGLSIDIIVALVGGFVWAVGKICEELDPGMVGTIQKGGEVLGAVGRAIGDFFGEIVAGFGETVTESWATMATNLSNFAENLEGFFTKMKEYGSPELVSCVGNFAKALLEITGAEFLDNITHPFSGTSSMEEFGKELVKFAAYFGKFVELTGDIEYSEITKAHAVAGAVKALAEAAKEIPNQRDDEHSFNFASLIFGDNDIGLFGKELDTFMDGFGGFIEGLNEIEQIDSEKISAVATAVETMAAAAQEIPNQRDDEHPFNIASLLFGDNDIGLFGSELEKFITPFQTFCNELNKIDNIDSDKISSVAKAVSELAQAAQEIPNQRDDEHSFNIASMLFGDNDLGTFGQELANFIEPFGTFVSDLNDMGDIDFDQISGVAKAIDELATAAEKIPNNTDEAWFSKIFGSSTELDEFGDQLEKFGKHFKTFADDVKGVTLTKAASVSAIVRTLGNLATELTSVAIGNLSSFGTNLGNFSASLPAFIESVNEINTDKISSFATAITDLVSAVSSVGDDVSGGLEALSTLLSGSAAGSIEEFTSGIGESANSMAEAVGKAFSDTASTIESVGGLTELFKAMKKAGEDTVEKFAKAVAQKQNEAKTAVQNLAKAAQNAIPSDFAGKFQQAGTNAATKFCSAISTRNTTAYSAGSGLVSSALNGVNSSANTGAWYQVGANLASGLVQGLGNSAALRAAAEKAANLVRTAKRAAEREGAIKSPSRVFYRIGNYLVEGLVNAMEDGVNDAAKAGSGLVSSAIKQAKSQLNQLKDVMDVNTDFSPVITPVVDLSEVQTGARSINQILGTGPFGLSLGNEAMLSRLSLMASSNGDGNRDVVNAINGLKDKGLGKTTINITVDGTENPEEFASRLVNAIKMRSRI